MDPLLLDTWSLLRSECQACHVHWKLSKLVPALKMLYINLSCWWLMFFFSVSSWGKSTLLCAVGWNCSSCRNRSFYDRENICPDEEDWSVSCQTKQRNRGVCSESTTVCGDKWSLETCGCMYIFFFFFFQYLVNSVDVISEIVYFNIL